MRSGCLDARDDLAEVSIWHSRGIQPGWPNGGMGRIEPVAGEIHRRQRQREDLLAIVSAILKLRR